MLRSRSLAAAALGAILGLMPGLGWTAAGASPPPAPTPTPGYVRGLEALALLETLNAELLSHDSATATLQAWCDAHGGAGARIKAERVHGQDKPPTEAARIALELKPGQAVRYRRVRLTCAGSVLSDADNWYRPDQLTPEMNRVLDTTDTPFGVVARPLGFRRRTLSARLLYHPLPEGWERGAPEEAPPSPIPPEVLQHSAVLTTMSGAPLSFVVETYTGQALEIALPR